MTKEEIEINEALIAEFMDLEYIPHSQSNGDNGWWKKGTFKDGCSVDNSNFICIHTFGLKYNSDFNKLMEVVSKITAFLANAEYMFVFNPSLPQIFDYAKYDESDICFEFITINSTKSEIYSKVVEFINFYNQFK